MHSGAINREYKFKFYLNANHYIIIDGKEGEQHPHTWEFMVHIRMNGQKFVQFDAYEKAIDEYFNQYQNHLINEIEPFDHIIPTLENMSDYFVRAIKKIVQNLDGELVRMESSEGLNYLRKEKHSGERIHVKKNWRLSVYKECTWI